MVHVVLEIQEKIEEMDRKTPNSRMCRELEKNV